MKQKSKNLPAENFMNMQESLILHGSLAFSGIVTKIECRLVKFEENPVVKRFFWNWQSDERLKTVGLVVT